MLFPTYFTPQATHALLERGCPLGNKWLGLLTPEEAVTFGRNHDIGGLDYQSRRRLYAADMTQQPTFFGPKSRYSNFQPLTEDFLAPGILAEHRPTGHHALIYRHAPDSIQDPNAPVHTDPMHTAREMLVSVNWATGAVLYQDQRDTAKHPEALPQ